MILHKIFLVCDAPGCQNEIFLKALEHKRQIIVKDLRKLAGPQGWVTRQSRCGEVSYCPEHGEEHREEYREEHKEEYNDTLSKSPEPCNILFNNSGSYGEQSC